jgi:2-keto-4-pentenoate hydratase
MSTARTDTRILTGMRQQLELRKARLDAGAQPIGWKVGFGTPAVMKNLGTDAPVIGFLTDTVLLPSESIVGIAEWTRPAFEPEIAVYMGADLAADADRETARAAIAAIGPAIELADVRFAPEDVTAVLADNVFNRHVILGRKDTSRAGCAMDGVVGHVFKDGEEVATVDNPQAATGDLIDIVRHVADVLEALGERLRAGELIITGSIIPAIGLMGGEEFRYTLDPIDTLAVTIGE